jgi:diguanylate cyclase (GGDEF)-like protein
VPTEASRIAIPGFELVEELGRGASTAVYRALREGEEYAVKIQELSGSDDPARIGFRREAAILAAIRHPCLAKVFEVGDDGRTSWLAMELIGGRTLAQVIDADGALAEARVLSVASDVASALDAAHRVGLVHRDVAPRNIVLRADGRAVLIDFGLATQTGTRQPEDAVVGTVMYSAPEQTGMVRRPVDRRSDLYSLGAILYECVTGAPPFYAEDAGEVVRMHAVTVPQEVKTLRSEISVQLSRIIAKLLAKDPDDRYQGADSLLSDIEALRRQALPPDAVLGQATVDSFASSNQLIGRDQELAALIEILDECRASGSGSAVLIESEPGGGKSRLAAELARVARSDGMTVLDAHLGLDHPGPLGPLAQAVGRLFAELELRDPQTLQRLRQDMAPGRSGSAGSLIGLSVELDRFLAPAEERPNLDEQASESPFQEFAVIEAAHLLMAVANASPSGAVLLLDNAHLADDATHRVLAYLAPELDRLSLVVVLTARTDAAEAAALGRLRLEMGEAVRRRIELPSLPDEDISAILRWQLGENDLDTSLADEITLRASGNPAAAVEYLRSALEAGVLVPSWGTFSVDAAALANLDLPTDVRGLALRRLDGLRPATRWLLTEASVIGSSFNANLLSDITRWPASDVHVALAEAVKARVVESLGVDRYVFLHEAVRDTLLASIDEKASKRAHEMLGRALEESGDVRPEIVYEIARHYAVGEIADDPARAFKANHRAARLALGAQADDDALGFLSTAESIAAEFEIVVGSAFETDYGTALSRAGQVNAAMEHYENALGLERDRTGRARIHEHIARVYFAQSSGANSLDHARLGLSELGTPLPKNAVLVTLSTLWSCLMGFLVGVTRIGFGRAHRAHREKLRLECRLLEIVGNAADSEHRSFLAVGVALRALLPANRLGHSREYVGAYAHLGLVFAQVRLISASRLVAKHTRKVAQRTGDHATIVHAKLIEAISLEFRGEAVKSEELLIEILRQEARWLQPGEYLNAVLALCIGLGLRGRILEQVAWVDEATWHSGPATRIAEGTINGLDFIGIGIAGLLEQPTVGIERITHVNDQLSQMQPSRIALAGYQVALTTFNFGLNELGEPFEKAINDFRARKLPPWNCPYNLSSFWLIQAYGRINQLLNAPSDSDRRERSKLAHSAVLQLRAAARTPLLRAHYYAARAGYLVAKKRYKAALRASARGSALLVGLDAPGCEMAIQMARSRALALAGHAQESERMAVASARLAEDLGITSFVRWIQPPMPERRRGSSIGQRSRGHTIGGPSSSVRVAGRAARQLEALLQVGAAAARVLDPEELARLALDETVRILNAERALLFLTNENTGIVRPHMGRDAAGNDIASLTGYSTTIVDKVVANREAMVLTGTEEGAALGSESAVTHGLRSILVAPLQIEDRLLGVVYLDSRLAKGIFTRDDVEILSAITSNVAFALETARIAEMELSVASERRQRQVAELLRDSMKTVGQSLEPRGVLRAILQTSMSALNADAGAILLAEGERLEVAAAIGGGVTLPPEGYDTPRSDQPEIAEALRGKAPLAVSSVISDSNSPLFGLLGRSGSFIVAPLVARDEAIGALVIIARRPNAFGQTQTEVASALAGQGVVAYENAQLFARVQTLAQRDELSGVANRRYFFELAGRSFREARQMGNPLSAMMLDIDHFKDVNDRYGHASGDDVIRVVANRVSRVIGAGDIVGRYGGEEFALVVQAPGDNAAELAERLRRVISETPIATASGPVPITASVGVAEMAGRDADLGRLLQRTDAALYEAKRAGRDRIILAS